MLGRVSKQLLTLLQLTRMALVFTALSNAFAALALRSLATGESVWPDLNLIVATVAVAVGLYGYGMALNDIMDRRRDRHLAHGRPLPSGRIGVGGASVVAGLMLAVALAGGWVYVEQAAPGDVFGVTSLLLVVITAGFITAYDILGKYLVWAGLLLLGLIRFFHATVPAPQLPVVWHPLWLLNHVAIVSAVAYRWEAKRPPLTKQQGLWIGLTLVAMNVMLVATIFFRRGLDFAGSLRLSWALIPPIALSVAFAVLGTTIKKRANDRRAAGKALILYGLLWLVLYDAAFVIGYVSLWYGLALLAFWPVSYGAVRAMRVWASMTDLARRPVYVRADEPSRF